MGSKGQEEMQTGVCRQSQRHYGQGMALSLWILKDKLTLRQQTGVMLELHILVHMHAGQMSLSDVMRSCEHHAKL